MTDNPNPRGVSVCILAKNCADNLKQCLESLTPFIDPAKGDEILVLDTGSTDSTPDIARQHGSRIFVGGQFCSTDMLELVKKYLPDFVERCSSDPQYKSGFMNDFAAARNFLNEQAKNDLIFWVDSDDVVIGAAKLRSTVDEFFASGDGGAMMLSYDYSFDSDGRVNTVQWRERIFDKKYFFWKGRCHETAIPKSNNPRLKVAQIPVDTRISHKNHRHHLNSDIRNYAIMRAEIDAAAEAKTQIDPRTLVYLGHTTYGLADGKVGSPWFQEALRYYKSAIARSGSKDDRLHMVLQIASIYIRHNRPRAAYRYFSEAVLLAPEDPRPYYGLARVFFCHERWEECLRLTRIGHSIEMPNILAGWDPQSVSFFPQVFEALSLKKLGRLPEAMQLAHGLREARPGYRVSEELYLETMAEITDYNKKVAVQTLEISIPEGEARKSYIAALPKDLRRHASQPTQVEVEVRGNSRAAYTRELTILCANTIEPWADESLEAGVGGSEKMVILYSRELSKRGWAVDIYANPPGGESIEYLRPGHGPVRYMKNSSFNPALKRDIVLIWRAPAYLDMPLQARKVFIDMHDVAHDPDFSTARLEKCHGVFFKSKAHRTTAPSCPDEKAIVSRNAVDLAFVDALREAAGPRDYARAVWTSSPDRGLLRALQAWQQVKNALPDAKLVVTYGFTDLYTRKAATQEYQYYPEFGHEAHMFDYQESCMALMDELGVDFRGRTPSEDLTKLLLSSSVWLYPTKFYEISCMSAMEAQVCGCLPVCSNHAALAETVSNGLVVNPDDVQEIAQGAVKLMEKEEQLDSYRETCMTEARSRFSLTALVDDWVEHFIK